VGRGLLAVALLAPLARLVVVRSVDWTPLEMPLARGATAERSFEVGQSGTYELALRIDRPADRERRTTAECALGFDFVECEGRAAVRLRWHLRSNDGRDVRCGAEPAGTQVVDARSSGGRFTPAFVERWLGCMDARDGAAYALRVEALSGIEALEPLHARFVVQSSSALDRDQQSLTAAIWMTSLLVGVAGAVVASRPMG
jgi:hypothetical protein